LVKSVAMNEKAKSYFVELKDGQIKETVIPTEVLK